MKLDQNLGPKSAPSLLNRWLGGLRRGPATATREERAASASGPYLPPELERDGPLFQACLTLAAGLAGRPGAPPPSPLALIGTGPGPACPLVAAGLACVWASEGRSTLLVDTDLRTPQLGRLFGLSEGPGFADMLAAPGRDEQGGDLIAPTPIAEGLHLLQAGQAPGTIADLLRPTTLLAAVQALSAAYDTVIFSALEQLGRSDGLLVATAAGAAVLAVAAGSASADELRRIRGRLERGGVQLLGFTYVEQS